MAAAVANDLEPAIRPNRSRATIIFPGQEDRRNYSNNAIDCGILVDSFHDLQVDAASASKLRPLIEDVVHTYLVPKLRGPKIIHNQYLWAATGLARWIDANPDTPRGPEYRGLVGEVLEHWLNTLGDDGYAPYMSQAISKGLEGPTTYYHSRCIAFALYAAELTGQESPDFLQRHLKAAEMLAGMYQPSGVKNLLLETKRWYFWGPDETGSHPYDVYVFWRMAQLTRDDAWTTFAGRSLAALLQSPRRESASRARDWQCETMRVGHLAWLTRIPDTFLLEALERRDHGLRLTHGALMPRSERRLALVGEPETWVGVLTAKAPLTGHTGGRATGLMVAGNTNINDLVTQLPLHYRIGGSPLASVGYIAGALAQTGRHVYWRVWQTLRYKHRPVEAARVLWLQVAGFCWAGLRHRSTEFCCALVNIEQGPGQLSYELVATDVGGHEAVSLGRRTVGWQEGVLSVDDLIDYCGQWRLRVPEGWECSRAPSVDGYLVGRGPVRISLRGPLSAGP